MPIECNLVQRTSKNGKDYVCLEIRISEHSRKIVFLTDSELELIKLTYQKVNK